MSTTSQMRALSWKEPFASLMLCGKIETRTWATPYRGKVLMCASKAHYTEKKLLEIAGHRMHSEIIHTLYMACPVTVYQSGCAFAVMDLVDCRPMQPEDEAKCFVKYRPGLWCHVYENVQRIKPIAWKGTQGWKTLTPEFIETLEYLEK